MNKKERKEVLQKARAESLDTFRYNLKIAEETFGKEVTFTAAYDMLDEAKNSVAVSQDMKTEVRKIYNILREDRFEELRGVLQEYKETAEMFFDQNPSFKINEDPLISNLEAMAGNREVYLQKRGLVMRICVNAFRQLSENIKAGEQVVADFDREANEVRLKMLRIEVRN